MNSVIKIVLIMNKILREQDRMQKIKQAIEKKNIHAQVFIIHWLDPDFLLKILEISPNVVLTFPLTAKSLSYRLYILKFALNFLLVTFRTEGILLNTNSKTLVKMFEGKDDYGVTLIDHEIFWGAKTSNIIGKNLLEQNKISSLDRVHYFGTPLFESYLGRNQSDNELPLYVKTILDEYSRKNILLIVTGFHYAEYSSDDILRAGDLVDSNSKTFTKDFNNWLIFINKCKFFRQMWIDAIIYSARKNPHLLFVVKMHPAEIDLYKRKEVDPYSVFNKHKNVLLIIDPISFCNIIPYCSILFHYGSTTMLEAYISKVPSVYVDSKQIKTIKSLFNPFEEPEIPSNFTIDIYDFPGFVLQYKSSSIHFQRIDKIDAFLKEQVDLILDEPYRPSDRIANFLLSIANEKAQTIVSNDKHLLSIIHGKYFKHNIIPTLCERGFAMIESGKFLEALKKYLDPVLRLSTIGQYKISKLQYARSFALSKLGLVDQAIIAIKEELTFFPNNKQAQDLNCKLHATSSNGIIK